ANPYVRESKAETISAILTADPPSPKRPPPESAAGLTRIAQKCLKKDRRERYQSASEILLDLDNLQRGVILRAPRPGYAGARVVTLFLLLLSLIIGAAFLYSQWAGRQTLAVLPLITESSEADVGPLGAELTASLIDRLSRVPKLRVTSA